MGVDEELELLLLPAFEFAHIFEFDQLHFQLFDELSVLVLSLLLEFHVQFEGEVSDEIRPGVKLEGWDHVSSLKLCFFSFFVVVFALDLLDLVGFEGLLGLFVDILLAEGVECFLTAFLEPLDDLLLHLFVLLLVFFFPDLQDLLYGLGVLNCLQFEDVALPKVCQ